MNGKKYIGKYIKCNSNEEFQQSNYWGSGIYIARAIKKYGIENFKKWVILHCDNKDDCFYEKLWIKKLNTLTPNGYNISKGGDGIIGYICTDTHKQKLKKSWIKRKLDNEKFKEYLEKLQTTEIKQIRGNALKKKWADPRYKSKMKKIHINRWLNISDERKKEISDKLKKPHYDEWNKNISISLTGKPKKELHKQHIKENKIEYYKTHTSWNKGIPRTENELQKMKKSLKKRWEDPKAHEKQSIARKKYCETHIMWNKGKEMSEEQKAKLKIAWISRREKIKFNKIPFELYTSLIGEQKCLV
jgi:hypothetical protein